MAANHVPMMRCLNPITHSIHNVNSGMTTVGSLQTACIAIIKRAVTLKRFGLMQSLPLPKDIIRDMEHLCLNHFLINPDEVTGENHQERTFPATCLIDGTQVFLQLCEQGQYIPPDPALLATFMCSDIICLVYQRTNTLAEKIFCAKESNTPLNEQDIWRDIFHISQMVSVLPPVFRVTPKQLHHFEGMVLYRPPLVTFDPAMTEVANSTSTALYESPEILMQGPVDKQTHTWALGCIFYELCAREPAYYDREGTGNLMEVMMRITEGVPPPIIPSIYSQQLQQLIGRCLQIEANERITVSQIIQTAQEHL